MRSPDLVFLIENFHKVSAGFHFIVKKFFFKFYLCQVEEIMKRLDGI